DRLAELRAEGELRLKRPLLRDAGRVVVMVIESGLTDSHHFGLPEQLLQAGGGVAGPARRLVGVQPGRGREAGALPGEGGGPGAVLGRRADHDDVVHGRLARPFQHRGAIRIEGHVDQVAVGVDQVGARHWRASTAWAGAEEPAVPAPPSPPAGTPGRRARPGPASASRYT